MTLTSHSSWMHSPPLFARFFARWGFKRGRPYSLSRERRLGLWGRRTRTFEVIRPLIYRVKLPLPLGTTLPPLTIIAA